MELFGVIAQRKQYVSGEEVEKALAIQRRLAVEGKTHKLLGIIMLELGMLSSCQLLDILQEMEKGQKFSTY